MIERTQSPEARFGIGLLALFLVTSAAISGYFLTKIFLEARASENWPTVDGRLTKVRVGETGVGRFFADVSYSYEVDGQSYTGSRVRTSDGEFQSRDGAAQAIRGLHEGQRVTVHYNPSDPGKSVLHAGAGFQEYALLGVPIVLLAMGVRVFWQLRRRTKSILGVARGHRSGGLREV